MRAIKFIFSFVLLFFLNSCNEASEPKSSPVKNTKLGAAGLYPHTEPFIKGQHGQLYYQDSKTCKSCHGEDFSGGNSKVSCTSCHQSFPHTPGWSMPTNHAKTYLLGTAEGKQQCLKCHQSINSGSQSLSPAMSCNSCHASFPHARDFKNQHKELAKENPGACIDCHSRSSKHVSILKEQISCNSCHGENFPHPPGWARSGNHGAQFVKLDEAQRSACLTCHTPKEDEPKPLGQHPVDLSATPSCKECHAAYPHPAKFEKPKLHAGLARTYEGKCTLCHTDYKKHIDVDKYDGVGCISCHEDEGDTRVKWLKENETKNNRLTPLLPESTRVPQSKSSTRIDDKSQKK